MTKPYRIQLSREANWRLPPNTVKVDRSTRHANPYRSRDAQKAVEAYRNWWQNRLEAPSRRWALRQLEKLRGKNLACWCKLDEACHADVLLELANRDNVTAGAPDAGQYSFLASEPEEQWPNISVGARDSESI